MKRRHFLSWMGVGALASSLPVALAACNSGGQGNDSASPEASGESSETASPETAAAEGAEGASSDEAFVAVGPVADLDSQGFIANEDVAGGPVIVIRDPEDTDSLIALDSRCPHRGCAVEWQSTDNQFVCPCHRSSFEPDGSLVSGPASTSLDALEAKVEGDQVLVKTT